LQHCAAAAIKGKPSEANAMYEEILDLFARYSR
jgi:hypothetical protein